MPEPKKEPGTVKLEQVPTQNMIGILNDQSIEVLNSTFKEDTPNALKYTLEDYQALIKIYSDVLASYGAFEMSFLSIMVCLNYSINKDTTPSEIYAHIKRQSKISYVRKDLVRFMYDTPLNKVPLYINHKNLGPAAKWRLSINK